MAKIIIKYQNPYYPDQTQEFHFTDEYKNTIADPQGPLGLDCYTLFWLRKIQALTYTESSSENSDFLIEVYNLNLLRKNAREDDVREALEEIYETYIVESSPHAINISYPNRNDFITVFGKDQENLSPETLQEAVESLSDSVAGEVLSLMSNDSFSRYRLTDQFEHDVSEFQDFSEITELYIGRDPGNNEITRVTGVIMELLTPEDWNQVSQSIESVIQEQVSQALDKIPDPFLMSVEDLNRALLKQASLQDAVRETLLIQAFSLAVGSEELDQAGISDEQAEILFEDFVVAPRYSQMIQESGAGGSYLSAAVSQVALEHRSRWLAENAGNIQEQLAAAKRILEGTSAERQQLEEQLKQLEQEKRDSSEQEDENYDAKSNLDDDIDRVMAEIAEKVKEQEEQQEELDKLKELDLKKVEDEIKSNKEKLESRHNEIFEAV